MILNLNFILGKVKLNVQKKKEKNRVWYTDPKLSGGIQNFSRWAKTSAY
jgi:hypothetical protein